MTTYAITGVAYVLDEDTGQVTSFDPSVSGELVAEDTQTSVEYARLQVIPGDLDSVEFTPVYNFRIDGTNETGADDGLDLDFYFGQIDWDIGGGSKSTFVMTAYDASTDMTYAFVLGGDELPAGSSAGEFNDFLQNSVTYLGSAKSGTGYEPGDAIALASIPSVTITENDTIDGTPDDDVLLGGAGDDIIHGFDGNDQLDGGDGNDTLNPGDNTGDDGVFGSIGNDTVDYSQSLFGSQSLIYGNLSEGIVAHIDGQNDTASVDKGVNGTDTLLHVANPLYASSTGIGGFGIYGTDHSDSFDVMTAAGQWMIIRGGGGIDNYSIAGDGAVRLDFRGAAHGANIDLTAGAVNDDGFGNSETISGTIWETAGTDFKDVIIGSSADESFIGNGGNDIIDGGGGFDRVRFDRSGIDGGIHVNLVNGNAYGEWNGSMFYASLSNIENLVGSGFDDVFRGSAAAELLEGRGGNDTLLGGGGDDGIAGGSGDDTIDGGTGSDTIWGDDGNDTIDSGAYLSGDYSNVFGGDGDDTLNGHSSGYFSGGAGNDRLIAYDTGDEDGNFMVAGYNEATSGIAANLTATSHGGLAGGSVANGFRIADGQGGVDLVSSFTTVGGSIHDDQFWVDSTYTSLYGSWIQIDPGSGDDTIVFGNGIDIARVSYNGSGGAVRADLEAGTATDFNASDSFIGNDTFSGQNQFRGTRFDDIIRGANGDDQLIRGESGNDTIYGRDGDDHLDGDDRGGNPELTGDDTLIGGAGADTLDGNNGIDTASYVGSSAGVNVSLATGTGTGGDAQGDTLIDIENLTGSDHNDTLTGDAGVNVLQGGAGDDTLNGGGGVDWLYGGADRDTLVGGAGDDFLFGNRGIDFIDPGAGADQIDGGGDFDRVWYGDSAAGVTVNLLTGKGAGGNAAGDTYAGIERITGSAHDDTLTGNEVANGIKGGAGNDTIYGGDGRDTIEGQAGSDTLYGGNANDVVMGGDGDDFVYGNRGFDKLDGGLGNDELWGGNDVDYFVFVTEGSNGFGQDIIRDFDDGADRIDVRGVHSMSDPSQVADQFSDFTVGESYLGLKIKFEGGQVIYLDTSDNHMTVADITADDFVFA